MSPQRRETSIPLVAAGIVFAALVGDILLAKIQVLLGSSDPLHAGDSAQFVLLLVAVVLFVAGTLQKEKFAGAGSGEPKQAAGPDSGTRKRKTQ